MERTRTPVVVAVAGLLSMIVLGLVFAGGIGPSALDSAVHTAVIDTFRGQRELLRLMLLPTEPYVLVPLLLTVAGVCWISRRRRDALLAVLTPPIAIGFNTWVLKPLFGRHYELGLAYPSGHTVSLVSALTVLFLLARPGTGRWVTAILGALVLLAAGTALIGLDYHFFTDVVGGTLFAISAVTGLWLVIQRVHRRPEPAPPAGSPRADTSSGIPR